MEKKNEFKGIELKPWQIKKSAAPQWKEKKSFKLPRKLNGFIRLFLFGLFCAYQEKIENYFVSFFPDDIDCGYRIASRNGSMLFGWLGIIFFWQTFIKGVWYSEIYEMFINCDAGINNNPSNLQSIKNYRSSKLSTLSNNAAADEYLKTGWVDSLENSNDTQVKRVMETISGKLSVLSQSDGYEMLKKK